MSAAMPFVAGEVETINPKKLRVGSPFAELFPILPKTLDAIRKSMGEDGYRNSKPIEVWRGRNVVVDGHTRRQAAIDAGLSKVAVFYLDFDSEESAIEYAIASQRDRRNLTDQEIFNCVMVLDAVKKKGYVGPNPGRSSRRVAGMIGCSATKVELARRIRDKAPEEIREEFKAGKLHALSTAYNKMKPASLDIPVLAFGMCRINGTVIADTPEVALVRKDQKIDRDIVLTVKESEPVITRRGRNYIVTRTTVISKG